MPALLLDLIQPPVGDVAVGTVITRATEEMPRRKDVNRLTLLRAV